MEIFLIIIGKLLCVLAVVCSVTVLKKPDFYLFLGDSFKKIRCNLTIFIVVFVGFFIGMGFIFDQIRFKNDFIVNREGESLTNSLIYVLFSTEKDIEHLEVIGNSIITLYARYSIINFLASIILSSILFIVSILFLLRIFKIFDRIPSIDEYQVAIEKYNKIYKWNYVNESLDLTDKERKMVLVYCRTTFAGLSVFLINFVVILYIFNFITIKYISEKIVITFGIFKGTYESDIIVTKMPFITIKTTELWMIFLAMVVIGFVFIMVEKLYNICKFLLKQNSFTYSILNKFLDIIGIVGVAVLSMISIVLVLLIVPIFLFSSLGSGGTTNFEQENYQHPGYNYINDYYRSDGTHVEGHWKTNPDEYLWNNLRQ
ncbi:hypothetical protein [Paenibacillus sp. An7]|uniref:hypothetical protein n=1 Tax=Paenibacillus sp. An7 TaxID=2689577 RepID=UPI00135A5F5B|nr:hypothetical protein [Paenibacillus sp. An7]